MIQATRNWFKRNRANFAIGAGIVGAGYLATQYVVGKITETRQRMSDDRIARENLRRRFEQNQEDCTFTVLAILPTAYENLVEALPVEQTLAELQRQKEDRLAKSTLSEGGSTTTDLISIPGSEDGKSHMSFTTDSYVHASQAGESVSGDSQPGLKTIHSKKSKLALWNEMKISAIARTFTLIYTLALLTLLTRIQLNLLGRRNYLASVVSLATPQAPGTKIKLENRDDDNLENAYGNDFDTNRKYLSFSWWLLNRGCKDIMTVVVKAVKEVFGPVNPREDLTLEQLSELCVEVRKRVEGSTEYERAQKRWLPFLLPSNQEEDYVLQASGMTGPLDDPGLTSPSLRRLIDETSDLIDSPPFSHVLTLLLDSAFSLLVDTKISTLAYKIPPTSASTARIVEIVGTDAKARLAQSIPVFSRQAHVVGSGSTNDYLSAMEAVKDLNAFAAVVYSSNFEFEAPEWETTTGGAVPSRGEFGTSALPTPAAKAVPDEEGFDVGGSISLVEADFQKAWDKAAGK